MESVKTIVKGTTANLSHICNGKVYFRIQTKDHLYQLEIDCMNEEWKNVYINLEYKSILLMRWINRGIEQKDETFIMLS